jgi:hypothetical protein
MDSLGIRCAGGYKKDFNENTAYHFFVQHRHK